MSDIIETIKIKPTSPEQGEFVLINKSDFDASVHKLFGEPEGPTRGDLDEALALLPGSNTDADYVVRGMRSYFGDLFTADDESKVRELVKPAPAAKPSEGLKVDEIKAALEAKGIAIPEGVTLKADLAALLDAA